MRAVLNCTVKMFGNCKQKGRREDEVAGPPGNLRYPGTHLSSKGVC